MRDHPTAGRDPATGKAIAGRDPATSPAKKKAKAAAAPLRSMQVIVTGIDVATGKKVSVLVTAQGRDPATGKATD
jgi:hypothetical protein